MVQKSRRKSPKPPAGAPAGAVPAIPQTVVGAPIGSPTYVVPNKEGGGVIDVGQATVDVGNHHRHAAGDARVKSLVADLHPMLQQSLLQCAEFHIY